MSDSLPSIVFLGAGNVATRLSLSLKNAGFSILQVWSRTLSSARQLAEQLQCNYCCDIAQINPNADIYIYALVDSAIAEVSSLITFSQGLHLHTAGSISIQAFNSKLKHTGVLYPFQTFSKNKPINISQVPFFIESSDAQDLSLIRNLALHLSQQVYEANLTQRSTIHLSGVFACNFTNHLYYVAEQLLQEQQLPFNILIPLIHETVEKLSTLTPLQGQTGPAIRNDEVVMKKHIQMLMQHPQWKELYQLLSTDIQKVHS